MAEYLSGGIYFSGIGNGTDFGKIVDQLKTIEEMPKKRLESWKSDWKVRYDAFTEVIDAMRDAQSKLTALNSPSKFVTKVATSSKESILTAKADANALDSNHSIEVLETASNAIWAYNGTYASKNTSVNTSGTTQSFSYDYKGKTYAVDVPPGTTLESLVNLVNKDGKNPGVRMNVIQTGGAYSFQMMGKDTGKDASLTVHPNGLDGMSSAVNTWSSPIGDPTKPFTDGSPIEYTLTNAKLGTSKKFTVPPSGSLTDFVSMVNADPDWGPGTATITTDSNGKSTLTLADNVTASGRGLENGKVTVTDRFVTNITGTGQVLAPNYPSVDAPDPNAEVVYSFVDSTGVARGFKMKAGQTVGELVDTVNKEIDKLAVKDPALAKEKLKITTDSNGQQRIEQIVGQGALQGPGLTASKETVSSIWSGEVEPARVLDTVRYTVEDRNGTKHTFDMQGSQNLNDLADAINAKLGANTAKVSTDAGTGKSTLSLTNVRSAKGEGLDGSVKSSDKWSIQQAKNARLKVDNWPNEIESASNTVKGVIEGVEFTILDTGKAQINIKSDKDSVKKNIQGYLDAVNSVVKTMQDLSKVEVAKEGDKTYDKKSQFNNIKGGVLTGNYGTQLLNSRLKTLTSDVPPGFERITGTDVLSGDMVASLAQLGIKTCTQEGDPNYGLFMIAPPANSAEMQAMDQKLFDDALANNLEDVVNLFAADNIAKSNSADFHYNSHIAGMAKAGSYAVSYTVNPDNSMGDVFINGVKAQASGDGKYTAGSDAGDAKSLSIQIDNLTPGKHEGKISIQQGKVGEMEQFFASELRYNKSETDKNGSLMILRENYKGIMDNIDKKIEKEESRLITWERNQRLEYSRLETLLGKYQNQMTSMQSQLGGLSSSYS